MIAVALVISTPIAANTNIVVGSATTWPMTCSRWLRPKRVKSGMLSDSVAQKPIIAVSDGKNTGRNSPKRLKLARLREQRAEAVRLRDRPREQQPGHHQHERRGPVLDRAQQVHAAIDDRDVEAPEEQEREPLGRRVAAEARAEQAVPARNDAREERVERLAADPGLDPEPPARDDARASAPERSSRSSRTRRARRRGRGCRTWSPDASSAGSESGRSCCRARP